MKRGKRGQAKKSSPKHSLRLADLDQARSAVLNSLPSKESQRRYRHAIDEFIAWYCSEPRLSFNRAVVTRYRIHLDRANSHRARLTAGSRPSVGSRTRPLIPDCSARISLLASGGSKARKTSAFVSVTGSSPTRQERSGRCRNRIR
jgi:hypothetical protein